MRAVLLAALMLCAATSSYAESGIASVYGGSDGYCGKPVAWRVARVLNCRALVAAHKALPFGSRVKVTAASGKSIVVQIVDRGPYVKGRIIDLSPAAAAALGISGLGRVRIEPASCDPGTSCMVRE